MHLHSAASRQRAPRASGRAWAAMLGLLVPMAVLVLAGLVVLWPAGALSGILGTPDDATSSDSGGAESGWDPSALADGAGYAVGTITMVDLRECPEPETYGCASIVVEIDESADESDDGDESDGADASDGGDESDGGEARLYVPPEAFAGGVAPGDRVKMIALESVAEDPVAEAVTGGEDPSGSASSGEGASADPGDPLGSAEYVFVDFDRTVPLSVLGIVYALLVVLVSGLKGLRALAGLGFAYAVIVGFLLPAVLDGRPAVFAATTAAGTIMFVVLYLAHGFSARTTTALLGTLLGIALTGALGALWTDWGKLAGIYSEEAYVLSWSSGLSTSDLVICAILISGLGVLNDVTITQAAAVWELAEARPGSGARELFASAMRIGRDHIASTVYTIAFAFAGGGLTVLLLVSTSSRSFLESLTLGELAIDVVSMLVCSIGLVLAIPLTTAIAVLVVRSGSTGRRPAAQVGTQLGTQDDTHVGTQIGSQDPGGPGGVSRGRREDR